MTYQMQVLVVVVAMTVISMAYEIKRDVFFNADVTSHRKSPPQNFFSDQPFIDKTLGLQTSAVIPVRDRTVSQHTLRDVSLEDRAIYPSGFPISRHQAIKQNSFTIASFRGKPLFKNAIPKNRELRGARTILRNNPFEGQSPTSEESFEGPTSTYGSQAPFKEQLFTTETSFKNLFHGQSSSAEQASLQKQATFIESPPIPNSVNFYQNDYIKPIDSYEHYKDIPTWFDGKSLMYTKYDNRAPELSSMPMVPSSEYLFPLNAETPSSMPPTPSSMPVIMHGHDPAMSSVSFGMGAAHSSEASKMELGPTLPGQQLSASNFNAPVDSTPTTVPSISVSANQSSIVGHILTSLTTKPSSPVMATSIAPSAGNNLEPIYFHATKHGAVSSSLFPLRELNSNMHAYAFSNTPKSSVKINDFDFLTPKNETQSSMLNYILPEEHKSRLNGIQNSFSDYALPVKLKHNWPLQPFSQPETSSYAPLSLNGKMKLVLPNMPVMSISWPIEIKSDVSTMLPLKLIMTPDAATRNKLPLGIDLPVDFTAGIPNSLTSSISNGISGSITSRISTGIPGSMTTDIPVRIPTLNLGQSLHHVEQLRQTQETRNPWYPTELQLQLGGFGGINYTLHTGNSATRPMEPGIAKAGLTSQKLPQPHAPAFAKIGIGYHL